jgi:hypothetical protein
MQVKTIGALVLALWLTGCATWTQTSVDRQSEAPAAKTPIEKIAVIEGDFKDRQYKTLGEISVTVNKTTVFHADPTPSAVNQALREKASEIGADAVVGVLYGQVGVSLFSWGSLQGKGRAIKFTP